MPGGISFAPTNGVGYFFGFFMAASSAAPIATPSAIHRPRLSVAAPMATPKPRPRPIPEAFGSFLGPKGSKVEANDLRVVQKLSTGANDRILTLIQDVAAVGDLEAAASILLNHDAGHAGLVYV